MSQEEQAVIGMVVGIGVLCFIALALHLSDKAVQWHIDKENESEVM